MRYINEHLHFSWAHIVAFLAIIFISYISFLGLSYLTEGYFIATGIGVVIIDIIILALFLCIQALKASKRHFKRKIRGERILVFLSPVIFWIMLVPFCHFWKIYDQRKTIESDFSNTIVNAKLLFAQYEDYCQVRINKLDSIMSAPYVSPIHKENAKEALTTHLLGTNYTNLKEASCQWINNVSEATVWNVFIIGNIQTITNAFTSWNTSLVELSEKVLKEERNVEIFDSKGNNVNDIAKGFVSIKSIYSNTNSLLPNWYSWIWIFGLYICLLLPYLLQERNTKNLQRLFRFISEKENVESILPEASSINKEEENKYRSFTLKN